MGTCLDGTVRFGKGGNLAAIFGTTIQVTYHTVQLISTYCNIEQNQMKSVGIWSLNKLYWRDKMIGYRFISSYNAHQGNTTACLLSTQHVSLMPWGINVNASVPITSTRDGIIIEGSRLSPNPSLAVRRRKLRLWNRKFRGWKTMCEFWSSFSDNW